MKKIKYKVGSLFAGIGGIDLAFKKAGFEIAWANEINKKCCSTYSANFKHKIICLDIQKVSADMLSKVDIITAGFPCQAFSIAGCQKGFDDVRGAVFFELARIISALSPSVVFLENVKNLKFHNDGKTFRYILDTLSNYGYNIKYKIMNACDYSRRPQNRDRIYILCFKNQDWYDAFDFPNITTKPPLIDSILEDENFVDSSFYYDVERYPALKELIMDSKKVYQFRNRSYIIENKRYLCPTLTASMGNGGNRVPFIIDGKGIRRLTPKECIRLQGFPENFIFPQGSSNASIYSQIGNSVSVPVIKKIAKKLANVMYNVDLSQLNLESDIAPIIKIG